MERANWDNFHRPGKLDKPIEVIKATPPGRRLPKIEVLPPKPADKTGDPRLAKLNKLFEKLPEAPAEDDKKSLSV